MKRVISILCLSMLFTSCNNQRQNRDIFASGQQELVNVRTIPIEVSDTAYRHVDQTFELTSYVILSNDVLLGEEERVRICKEHIYILDRTPKLVCFDMNGKVVFTIDNQGPGPEEYGEITDFAIDELLNLLWIYDSTKRRLVAYDLFTGEYRRALSATYMAPEKMAIQDGSFFFHMPNNFNYPDNPDMHYSLFMSLNGSKIDERFFPHDETAKFHFTYGEEHPFYYNEKALYYIQDYGDTVYTLTDKGARALYKVELPNPLPFDVLMQVTPSLELMESPYSWLLSNAYESDGVLNLWFAKAGSYYTALYDLQQDKLIYAGKRIDNIPTKDLLFFYPIRGVYEGNFYSVVPSFVIQYKIAEDSSVFPEDLRSMSADDNSVVAFYKVRR